MERISYQEAVKRQPHSLSMTIAAVRTGLSALPDITADTSSTVTVCAMGASTHAAEVLIATARRVGRTMLNPPASSWPAPPSTDWCLAISESGRSPEPIAALRDFAGPTVAMTNVPNSPISDVASATLSLGEVPDAGVYVSGYTGTIAALALLAEHMGMQGAAAGLDTASAVVADILSCVPTAIEEFLALSAGQRPVMVDVVGQDLSYAAAAELALLAREAARLPSAAFETRQFIHGPVESVGPGGLLVLFGPDTLGIKDRLAGPSRVVTVTCEGGDRSTPQGVEAAIRCRDWLEIRLPGPSSMSAAIAEAVVAQLLALALTDGSFEIGTFRHEFPESKLSP